MVMAVILQDVSLDQFLPLCPRSQHPECPPHPRNITIITTIITMETVQRAEMDGIPGKS